MDDRVKNIICNSEKVLIGFGDSFEYSYGDFRDESLKKMEKTDPFQADIKKLFYRTEHPNQQIIEAYNLLYQLVKDKDYFIVSTCIDDLIYESDFPKDKIVTPCGTYQYLQCSELEKEECKQKLLPVSSEFLQKNIAPVCPICGKPLCFNNIFNENYNEGGYLAQWAQYRNWLQYTINKKLCILELGVSLRFPNIIRWPFEKMGFYNNKANFIRVHEHLYHMTEELSDKGISIQENPIDFLLKQ